MDDYIATEMPACRIPDLALAVVRDGTIIRTGVYGLANVAVEATVGEQSVFAVEAGRRDAWYPARHENGRMFLRFAFDSGGRITGLQGYHV